MPSSSSSSSKGKFSVRSGGASSSKQMLPPRPSAAKKRARFGSDVKGADESDADDDVDDGDVGMDDDDDDDEEAIGAANAAAGKSDKTAKRKRRALDSSAFGSALDDFLGLGDDETSGQAQDEDEESAPAAKIASSSTTKPVRKVDQQSRVSASGQAPIFSLAPSVRSRISSSTLSAKAGRVATEERRARMDRFRVRDVIGGWGPPGVLPDGTSLAKARTAEGSDAEDDAVDDFSSKLHERALRKVAQRGVVKLFNAIRAAQSTSLPDEEDDGGAAKRRADKDLAVTTAAGKEREGEVTSRNNALGGKGRQLNDLSKANFLDLLKSGKGTANPSRVKA
ncbi:hypothetical protein BDZ90DRAFT_235027 [Jaminaea rosea]|uniref:Rrp15p-domain-containing protein n=1 Tax=Jaminaea rosea TaxID=1569628 RepID=A0A316UJG6_9BASI|nr:hypothetical protein BDZ90DRAFT_235027 [Jaminaea rosea]PWN24481.1 hypothetical protein BDZ90DRAFT_235027 [Jaminaea rosea]